MRAEVGVGKQSAQLLFTRRGVEVADDGHLVVAVLFYVLQGFARGGAAGVVIDGNHSASLSVMFFAHVSGYPIAASHAMGSSLWRVMPSTARRVASMAFSASSAVISPAEVAAASSSVSSTRTGSPTTLMRST